jgi:hypothetical protein
MATVELAKKIIEDSYPVDRAQKGYEQAERIGYTDGEEFFSIAVARILWSEEEVDQGLRYPVEPGSLDSFYD